MKHLIFTDAAKADVRRIDRETAMRILRAIHRLAATGVGDVIKLQGDTDDLRLRVGVYRVRFEEKPFGTYEIASVRHRSAAY